MLLDDVFVIRETLRKTPRFQGEIVKIKYFRCLCIDCGVDRGFMTRSRFNAKPRCVKCATNTKQHRIRLVGSHWSNNGFEPWNKSDKSTMTRSAIVKQATPPWLTPEQKLELRDFYRNCPQGYHVDHIMPLKGMDLSGLHVPWNLQWLPAADNLSKGNKVT